MFQRTNPIIERSAERRNMSASDTPHRTIRLWLESFSTKLGLACPCFLVNRCFESKMYIFRRGVIKEFPIKVAVYICDITKHIYTRKHDIFEHCSCGSPSDVFYCSLDITKVVPKKFKSGLDASRVCTTLGSELKLRQ